MPTKRPFGEVDAMKAVDEALSGLEADARNRVMAWAGSKYQTESPMLSHGGFGSEHKNRDAVAPSGAGGWGHIKDFLVRKAPGTLYERVACLAYYLEKSSGVTSFKANDLAQANTDARAGKIDNMPSVINDATAKYGFFAAAGRGAKALTAKGEALVEALPDRDRVKTALSKSRGRRAKTRRKKK